MRKFIKRNSKRVLSALLSVLMIAFIAAPASAVTSTVTVENKNLASRDIHAASLSEKAKAYYRDEVKQYITGSTVYNTFVALSDAEINDASNSYNA